MRDWQIRVMEQEKALAVKIEELEEFLLGDYNDRCEVLRIQLSAMKTYHYILIMRVKDFV